MKLTNKLRKIIKPMQELLDMGVVQGYYRLGGGGGCRLVGKYLDW